MTPEKLQKNFIPLFAILLVCDILAQWTYQSGVLEFQPFAALWFGALDDIFYAAAGIQALYFLLDPHGESRGAEALSTLATVKKVATLFSSEENRRARFPGRFYPASLRAVSFVSGVLLVALLASRLATSDFLSALVITLQRHAFFIWPVILTVGFALALDGSRVFTKHWKTSMALGFATLVVSMAVDSRWAHHMHHLFAALSSLQAWGAALCWTGFWASLDRQNAGTVETPLVEG